jgi:3-dehydroquinate dehydratase-2
VHPHEQQRRPGGAGGRVRWHRYFVPEAIHPVERGTAVYTTSGCREAFGRKPDVGHGLEQEQIGRSDRSRMSQNDRRKAVRWNRLVHVLGGPNLNLLSKRRPHTYGRETLADVERACRALVDELSLELRFHQSNREYEIIGWVHEARKIVGGIAINLVAFTHNSVAILDALNTFDAPVVEIHISNAHTREEFRLHSFNSNRADEVNDGFGTQSYLPVLWRSHG